MHTQNANAATDDTLRPLNKVIPEVIDGEKNPATYSRWVTKGIAGLDGKRIKLEVWYAGREPRTTIAAVRRFIAAVTEARLARMTRAQQRADDVNEEDLKSVGLALHGGCIRKTRRPLRILPGSDNSGHEDGADSDPAASDDSDSGSRSQTTKHPKRTVIGRRQ